MTKLLNLTTSFRHYDILAKIRSGMTTAITFSRQNDAGSRVSNTQYWQNLVLVVVLVSESKALYLTIIPRARMGSESMGYWLRGHVIGRLSVKP